MSSVSTCGGVNPDARVSVGIICVSTGSKAFRIGAFGFRKSRVRQLRMRLCWAAVSFFVIGGYAEAGPIDIVLNPSPQATDFSCQSYAFALAMAFNPASPFQAQTTGELRDLERSIRSKIEASAKANGRDANKALRSDWPAAVKQASNQQLEIKSQYFVGVDDLMRFVAATTGISQVESLGTSLSIALVKTPVLLSFLRIKSSNYNATGGSHIATVLGVQLPNQTMNDDARPKLLIVNSAVKYGKSRKNLCWSSDLSDNDRYQAEVSLTDDYDLKNFGGPKPYPADVLGKP